jgi:hypothetical protein
METSRDTGSEEEQEVSQAAARPRQPPPAEEVVDKVIADSFPASDPPQWWAGPPD